MILGEIARQCVQLSSVQILNLLYSQFAHRFWERAIPTASPASQRHMIATIADFLESIVDQAIDRDANRYRTVDQYMERRRRNVGTRPSCVPLELGLDLTDKVFYHPMVEELTDLIVELIIIDNVSNIFIPTTALCSNLYTQDLFSYNRKQAMGDDKYNLISVAMRQFSVGFDEAVEWACCYHKEIEAAFIECLKRVPSFGPAVDVQLEEYIRGLANWPRCNDCWSFESSRYFGEKGTEYQKTRLVPRLPRLRRNKSGVAKKEQVVIPLVEELALCGADEN